MNRFLKGAMILTLAGIIVKIIGAFSKVLLARILGGEGIGLYQMAYPIYQIIVSLATAGLPVAISIMPINWHIKISAGHPKFSAYRPPYYLRWVPFSVWLYSYPCRGLSNRNG